MRYFAVTCKQGHHGIRRYYPITFAIAAETLLEACDQAKAMPGVKHSQPVLKCEEITFEKYVDLYNKSAYERTYETE